MSDMSEPIDELREDRPCIFDHNDKLGLITRMQSDGTRYDYCQGCGWVDIKGLLARETKAARDKAINDCIDVVRSKQLEGAQEITNLLIALQSQPVAENNQPAPQKGERE